MTVISVRERKRDENGTNDVADRADGNVLAYIVFFFSTFTGQFSWAFSSLASAAMRLFRPNRQMSLPFELYVG